MAMGSNIAQESFVGSNGEKTEVASLSGSIIAHVTSSFIGTSE